MCIYTDTIVKGECGGSTLHRPAPIFNAARGSARLTPIKAKSVIE